MRALLLTLAGFLLLGAETALAHGGSHPTPNPPRPTPTPPPTPPTPTPNPTPTPTPSPVPTGVPWYEWWWANQWRFLRIPQRFQVATGTGQDLEVALDNIAGFLESALKDRYFDTKAAAGLALGKAARVDRTAKVRALLRSNHDVVRESAFLALGLLQDGDSVPLLSKALLDPRETKGLRVHAALALALTGAEGAAGPLRKALETETGPNTRMTDEIRAAAALGLGILKDLESVALMIRVFESDTEGAELRAAVATALGKFETPSIMLEEGEISIPARLMGGLRLTQPAQVRRASLMALGSVWYDGLGSSLLGLHRTDTDPWMQGLSLLVLAEHIKNPNVMASFHKILREILEASRDEKMLKGFAALAAGLSKDRESLPILRRLFQEERSEEVKAAAAVGLGFLKDADSIAMLLAGLKQARTPFLKAFCCVAFALIEQGHRSVSAELRVILQDPRNTGPLRALASIALAKIGDTEAVKLLLDLMGKGNKEFRQLMVISVGYFRDLTTFVPLKQLFDGPKTENETKALVLVSLGHIVEQQHPSLLKKIFLHYNFLLPFENIGRIIRLM